MPEVSDLLKNTTHDLAPESEVAILQDTKRDPQGLQRRHGWWHVPFCQTTRGIVHGLVCRLQKSGNPGPSFSTNGLLSLLSSRQGEPCGPKVQQESTFGCQSISLMFRSLARPADSTMIDSFRAATPPPCRTWRGPATEMASPDRRCGGRLQRPGIRTLGLHD